MRVLATLIALAAAVSAAVIVDRDSDSEETSYQLGHPDSVVDEGDRWKVSYPSPDNHDSACPGHRICYITKGGAHLDNPIELGRPDNFFVTYKPQETVWTLWYASKNNPTCNGHYKCIITEFF